jgi:hypothetical protein
VNASQKFPPRIWLDRFRPENVGTYPWINARLERSDLFDLEYISITEFLARDEEWNREVTKWQALAQERLVGYHFCPDWDEMELIPSIGMIEYAACLCKPTKGKA